MSDRPHYGSPVAARLNELEDEIGRLHEVIRLREESQIPMIPHAAQQKMERLEAENQRLHRVLERRDELIEAEIQGLRGALDRIASALAPLDVTIDHSLYVGSTEQMAADLRYIRQILADARRVIGETLASKP